VGINITIKKLKKKKEILAAVLFLLMLLSLRWVRCTDDFVLFPTKPRTQGQLQSCTSLEDQLLSNAHANCFQRNIFQLLIHYTMWQCSSAGTEPGWHPRTGLTHFLQLVLNQIIRQTGQKKGQTDRIHLQ